VARKRTELETLTSQLADLTNQRQQLQESIKGAEQARTEAQQRLDGYAGLAANGRLRSDEDIIAADKAMKARITQEKAEWVRSSFHR